MLATEPKGLMAPFFNNFLVFIEVTYYSRHFKM